MAAPPRRPAGIMGYRRGMKRTTFAISIFLAGTALLGCKKKEAASTSDPVVAAGSGSGSAVGSGSAGSAEGSGAGSAGALDPGELKTPESVYYDTGRDMYMVSN